MFRFVLSLTLLVGLSYSVLASINDLTQPQDHSGDDKFWQINPVDMDSWRIYEINSDHHLLEIPVDQQRRFFELRVQGGELWARPLFMSEGTFISEIEHRSAPTIDVDEFPTDENLEKAKPFLFRLDREGAKWPEDLFDPLEMMRSRLGVRIRLEIAFRPMSPAHSPKVEIQQTIGTFLAPILAGVGTGLWAGNGGQGVGLAVITIGFSLGGMLICTLVKRPTSFLSYLHNLKSHRWVRRYDQLIMTGTYSVLGSAIGVGCAALLHLFM